MAKATLLWIPCLLAMSCSQYQRYGAPQEGPRPPQVAAISQITYQVWRGEELLGKNQLRSSGVQSFATGLPQPAARELGLSMAMQATQLDSSGIQAKWTLSDLQGELGSWATAATDPQEWTFSCPARSGEAFTVIFSFQPEFQP